MDQYQKKKKKKKKCKSTKVKTQPNSLKNKDEVHEKIIDITNETKEKPYIKKETHLHIKNPTGSNINNTVPEKEVKEGVINLTGTKLDENKTRFKLRHKICS